jgi:hypothetical protein
VTGSLFDTPDGRLGVVNSPTGGILTVRLFTLSADGLTLSGSVDYLISDSWSIDEHGSSFDGVNLYRISYSNGYKAYDISSGTTSYDGTSWNLRATSGSTSISNPTFITHKKFLESKRVDLRTKCLDLLRDLNSELKDKRDEHVATWSERMRVPLWYRKAHGVLKDGENIIL